MESKKFDYVKYVNVGDKVIAPWDNEGKGIRCTVICAAGYHARVSNEKRGYDKWLHIDDLRVERAA